MKINQREPDESAHQEVLSNLQSLFSNKSLLYRALTHRSYMNEHPEALEDNERLEFLGDAVLDFLVGAWLYNHFPEMAEGGLTRMRAALVGNEQLAQFGRQIGWERSCAWVGARKTAAGRNRPALLGSTFEALVGALYLDKGIPAVKEFLEPFLRTASEQILLERKDQDPKSLLQEWAQSEGYGTPYYRTTLASGPDHDKVFEVEVMIRGKVYGQGSPDTASRLLPKPPPRQRFCAEHRVKPSSNFDKATFPPMPSRLTSLELQGYKTFASRTEFVFAENVTAIVGPNGSGKSNIADSIRWVSRRAVLQPAARQKDRRYDLCRLRATRPGRNGLSYHCVRQ
jgi:ribonuclease III